jgi:glycosyltransferase involved in cell wall biosynthesis
VDANIPKISVLMPVYNCELYINEAVDSILSQTFEDFEFLIIDDASTDETVSIIKSYNDARIQLIEKPSNTGYTNSLNFGLSIAKGEYIARMDGDDISLQERFAKQVAALDANPSLLLCGSAISIIGTTVTHFFPEKHEDIKVRLLKGNCIAHPSVMYRKEIVNFFSTVYDKLKEPAEDYDLWCKLIAVGKLHNLQEVLLCYRIHDSQVSNTKSQQQSNNALDSQIHLLNHLNLKLKDIEVSVLKKIHKGYEVFDFEEIKTFRSLKKDLVLKNNIKAFFETVRFNEYLNDLEHKIFSRYFFKRDTFSIKVYLQYLSVRNNWKSNKYAYEELKFLIKSLIFFKKT